VSSGRLVGINLLPQEPQVLPRLRHVLDTVPSYDVIALGAPVGLTDWPTRGGRACDRQARQLLGWPRSGAIRSAPCRMILDAHTPLAAIANNGGHLDAVTLRLLPRIEEVAREVQSHWQRTIFEANAELSFYQLNGDQPILASKRTKEGVAERRALLMKRLPGVEKALDVHLSHIAPWHLLDATAVLWTARRIAARAVNRVPENPEWNVDGVRMEIVR
jgi:predicted RNase H-like nuclease